MGDTEGLEESPSAAPSPALARPRRLPTRTSSGLIKPPTVINAQVPATSLSSDESDEVKSGIFNASSRLGQARQIQDSLPSLAAPSAMDGATISGPTSPQQNSTEAGSSSSSASSSTSTSYGPPKPLARKPASITGPLNATTSPVLSSLPVKRRGSYQSLKKHLVTSDGSLQTEDEPSVMSLLKKPTHWEKFGTIMVLYCTKATNQHDEITQMLSAEGYDYVFAPSQQEAVDGFTKREVFPDIVLLDVEAEGFVHLSLIKQFQKINPTIAVLGMGPPNGKLSAVTALQAGAADFLVKPLDLDELVARVERHAQRQHYIKLELEKALEDAKMMMQQLMPAMVVNNLVKGQEAAPAKRGGLTSVSETDFEEQMSELSEENQRLGAKLADMERKLEQKDIENKLLEARLTIMDNKIDVNADGMKGQLNSVVLDNQVLKQRVEELGNLLRNRL